MIFNNGCLDSFPAFFKIIFILIVYKKVPAQRALSSPSGEAAEDNVEEREKFWSGWNYGNGNGITEGQTDVEFEIVF